MSLSADYYNANCQLGKESLYESPKKPHLLSDNPHYFNTAAGSNSKDGSGGRGFFLFRRRNSVSKKKSDKGEGGSSKQRGSLRCLLRSKSGSSTTMNSTFTRSSVDEVDYTSPVFGTTGRYRSRLSSGNDNSACYDDEVFVPSTKEIQKQKFSATLRPKSSNVEKSSNRRHSIGSFIAKEKCRTGSVSDEVPKMPAPKPPTYNVGARLKDHFKLGDTHMQNSTSMDDILVITARHSEPGILWVNYLKTCFDKITKQRGRVPFNFLHLKIDGGDLAADLVQRCLSTKLQIVVICPSLIELPGTFLLPQLTSILKPDKVLGLLLDVTEERISDIHKSLFPSYKQWRRCAVRNQDQSFVCDFLGIATDILGRALRQQPLADGNATPASPMHISTPTSTKLGQVDNFSIIPRKVKVGQNKVVVLLNDPLARDDWIKIKIERTGNTTEITNVKRRNPYAIQFSIPEACMEVSMMINIRVEKNSQDLGSRPIKCESRLRELEQLLKFHEAPMEFMCTALGVAHSDREKLDSLLVQSFKKNVPPDFHLLASSGPQDQNTLKARENSPLEFPTMLHFAARWGLEKLCVQLLDSPGSEAACELRNVHGKTPADVADTSGHVKLSSTIRNFSQMNEFSTMYQFFKGMSEKSVDSKQGQKIEGEGYLVMSASGSDVTDAAINAVSNLNYINTETEPEASSSLEMEERTTKELKIVEPSYFDSADLNLIEATNTLEQLLPSLNSSVSSSSDYQNEAVVSRAMKEASPMTRQPLTAPKPQEFGDYLTHPSNIPISSPNYTNISVVSPKKIRTTYKEEASHLRLHFKRKDEDRARSLKRQASDVSKKSVDDELLEIINDFKNNVFTIQEVEQLVSTWKNRNDVQKSFIEKAEQLQRMREEYDRIQRDIKEKLKRPTPFERMKKLFSRSKSGGPKEACSPSEASTPTVDDIKFSLVSAQTPTSTAPSGHRPISSLSLHSVSSSSSGRMSTGSACSSLGDSGTHSDNDTRRNLYARPLLDNYLVPPAPRPVTTPSSTPTPVEDKLSLHFPKNPSSEHYIMFPSNVPFTPTPSTETDYINYSTPLKTIDETDSEVSVSMQPIQIKAEPTYAQATPKTTQSSSFKPNSPAVTIVNGHHVVESYNDVNKNTEQLLDELKFNEICKSIEDLTIRSPLSGTSSGTNSMIQSPMHHEYMNIKI